MEKWEIEVKEHWNKISDSEWYQSLRTDDRLSELYNNPETAFHPEMLSLMKKYIGNFTGKRILLPSSGIIAIDDYFENAGLCFGG